MTDSAIYKSNKSQLDKFKQAALELEAGEVEGRWDERLKKVAKGKPKPGVPDA
ncbi:MAG: hypothetical protein IPF48_08485 [Sphingomonadales bacterium]|nr:hypothetical protein [Sphingomonadales bacterium]MBK6490261.1 hypothetical protein [Sphingomonadales bacterium]MBK6721396.1 hypothetical protein [Sphingomonadales bacterium]MBK7284929.1 hypothetical protein [Sphingomonadales bacterium]MBK8860875.1 hypothetical protein [Sphingomonadales bacterium]